MNHLYLYVALIGVVLVLFALTRNGKKSAPATISVPTQPVGQSMLERDVKATLDEFIGHFEREQTQLLQTIDEARQDSVQQLQAQQELIQRLEQRVAHLEAKVEEQALQLVDVQETAGQNVQTEALTDDVQVPALSPELPKSTFAFNEKYAKVVELYRQGLTAEQIARETEIGLGEIHFVLGLVKQEES
jgi:flagellar motility protein MotE (MotC chaperone)